MDKYIEPRLRRDFGGIITAFFNFLKANFKGIINVFIGYNGLFFILFLVSTYFLVTGFVEFLVAKNSGANADTAVTSRPEFLMGISFIGLVLFIVLASIFNYALSSSYVSLYEMEKQNNIDKKQVWKKARKAFWGMVVLAILAFFMYLIYFVIQLVLAFIPILGTLASLLIGLGFNAWISLSIFSYIHNEDKNVIDAFVEAWQLLLSGFWKTIGVNVVLGLIAQICLVALQIVPIVIVGFITFHAVEGGDPFTDSTLSHILIIIIITLFCITMMFLQMISQIVNAFLYFNLHEYKHNLFLRSRIENIGSGL